MSGNPPTPQYSCSTRAVSTDGRCKKAFSRIWDWHFKKNNRINNLSGWKVMASVQENAPDWEKKGASSIIIKLGQLLEKIKTISYLSNNRF